MDRHPGFQAPGGRAREAPQPTRRAAQARRRPGYRGAGSHGGYPALARGSVRSQPSHRVLHVPRSHRRGQDGARQDARHLPLQHGGGHGPNRHERVHGEARGVQAHRRAPGLRRLRGRWPAHGGCATQALQRRPLRRDGEGARRRLQRAAPDPGRRPRDGQPGTGGELQERHPDHDVEHRLAVRARGHGRQQRRRQGSQEGEGDGGCPRALPTGVCQPRRRVHRFRSAGLQPGTKDRRAASGARAR